MGSDRETGRTRLPYLQYAEYGFAVASAFWLSLTVWDPRAMTQFALVLTCLLLLAIVTYSLASLFVLKRISVLMGFVQIGLFGLLYYQVYLVLGPDHFETDKEPRLWDWFQFAAVHSLHAVDFVDVLNGYDIDLNPIRHNSSLVATLLVVMHASVGLFLLAVLLRGCIQLGKRLLGQDVDTKLDYGIAYRHDEALRSARTFRRWRDGALAVTLVVVVACAVWQRWSPLQSGLWLLDNLARTADIGDIMQLFDLRLHGLEGGFWLATLGVALRFILGIYVAEFLTSLVISRLKSLAPRTFDDLVADLNHDNETIRSAAVDSLGELGPHAARAIQPLIGALTDPWSMAVYNAAARALERIGPEAEEAFRRLDPGEDVKVVIRRLTKILEFEGCLKVRAVDRDMGAATLLAALELVRWMGPAAVEAEFWLTSLVDHPDDEVKRRAAAALTCIDPNCKHLEDIRKSLFWRQNQGSIT